MPVAHKLRRSGGMDPRVNPYAPGAGTPPPELAGRDAVLFDARLAIQRNKAGRTARSFMFVGLRGVGEDGPAERSPGHGRGRGCADGFHRGRQQRAPVDNDHRHPARDPVEARSHQGCQRARKEKSAGSEEFRRRGEGDGRGRRIRHRHRRRTGRCRQRHAEPRPCRGLRRCGRGGKGAQFPRS